MKKTIFGIILAVAVVCLLLVVMKTREKSADPSNSGGQNTQAGAVTEDSETATAVNPEDSDWDLDTELNDGVFTIRIKGKGQEKKGYWWQYYTGDMGDASAVELLTQSNDEEGLAYAGSFRVSDGIDYSTDSTLRLVYTDGLSSARSIDFDMKIEGGRISECTDQSLSLPVKDENYESILSGSWKEEGGGDARLTISRNPEEGFDGTLIDAKGKEFTFNARYDCIQEAFLYHNDTEAEESYDLIAIAPDSSTPDQAKILLHDLMHTDGTDLTFIKD